MALLGIKWNFKISRILLSLRPINQVMDILIVNSDKQHLQLAPCVQVIQVWMKNLIKTLLINFMGIQESLGHV